MSLVSALATQRHDKLSESNIRDLPPRRKFERGHICFEKFNAYSVISDVLVQIWIFEDSKLKTLIFLQIIASHELSVKVITALYWLAISSVTEFPGKPFQSQWTVAKKGRVYRLNCSRPRLHCRARQSRSQTYLSGSALYICSVSPAKTRLQNDGTKQPFQSGKLSVLSSSQWNTYRLSSDCIKRHGFVHPLLLRVMWFLGSKIETKLYFLPSSSEEGSMV